MSTMGFILSLNESQINFVTDRGEYGDSMSLSVSSPLILSSWISNINNASYTP